MVWFVLAYIWLMGWIVSGKKYHEEGYAMWWFLAAIWPWLLILWLFELRRTRMSDDCTVDDDLLHQAWVVIANVSEGDWSEQPIAWQAAAIRWRDEWHATLSAPATVCVRLDGLHGKIAATIHNELNHCSHDALGDDCYILALKVVALLQSLAVQ
jgi:hypothetical protein